MIFPQSLPPEPLGPNEWQVEFVMTKDERAYYIKDEINIQRDIIDKYFSITNVTD